MSQPRTRQEIISSVEHAMQRQIDARIQGDRGEFPERDLAWEILAGDEPQLCDCMAALPRVSAQPWESPEAMARRMFVRPLGPGMEDVTGHDPALAALRARDAAVLARVEAIREAVARRGADAADLLADLADDLRGLSDRRRAHPLESGHNAR